MNDESQIRSALQRLGVSPSKGRGQNFLIDDKRAADIAEFAGLKHTDSVIEVGPGLGVLSQFLLEAAGRLTLIEVEEKFCEHLTKALPGVHNIVCADARTVDLYGLSQQPRESTVFVSNVPYSISTELVLWLFEQRKALSRAVLLFQREFAERLASEPGSRKYGQLTVLRSVYAEARLGPVIKGCEFYPPAEVDSRLIELRFKKEEPDFDPSSLRKIVSASFAHKRKTLLNSLSASQLFKSKNEAEEFLRRLNIDPRVRAEALPLEDFLRMMKEYAQQNSPRPEITG